MTPRRLKLSSILAGLALGALLLLAWTQPWVVLTLDDGSDLSVGGDVAAPAQPALALAALALFASISIAGRFFRFVLGVLAAAIGGVIVLLAVPVVSDPVAAASPAITEATGLSGDSAIRDLVTASSPTLWPWLSVALGLLLVVLGLLVLATQSRWPGSSRKYQAARLETQDGSAVTDWDALSEGHDPTGKRE